MKFSADFHRPVINCAYIILKSYYYYCFQILFFVGADNYVPVTVFDTVLVVERTVLVFVFYGRRHALHIIVTLHVVGQQRRSHLGHETIRQVSPCRFIISARHLYCYCYI